MKGRTLAALAAVAWIAGAGTAQAQFTVEGTYATGIAPRSVYAADFNRDGRPDAVASNQDAGTLSVFLRGTGGFTEETGSPFAMAGATSYGTVGDFNGDGYPDLAISDFVFGNGVVIALRNGAGGFTRETVPLGGQLGAVGAGDFNLDGRTDIVVATFNAANLTVLLRNPGNDGFSVAPSGNYAVQSGPRQFAVADFDGNGQTDIAVTNSGSGSVSVLLNSGAATFAVQTPVAVGAQPSGIAAGDFNGDGRTDLAVANNGDSTVSILSGTPLGFTASAPVAVGAAPVTVAAADFDANGTLDIAVTTNASLDVIRSGTVTSTPTAAGGSGLALADFNADGRMDAVVTSQAVGLMTVLLSPSPPAQPPPQPTPTPTPTLDNPQVNREVNVLPVSGTVKIKRKGSNRYVDLKAGEQIPNGSSIDARKGRVTIVAAQSATKVERADFFQGLFTVSQTRKLTTVTLSEQLSCSRGKASAAQKKKPKSRKLWGDGKGKFRTKGRYAAATVRGTRWLVADTCTTTKVTVRQGSVSVRDDVRKRTVIVRKGKSYTARARR